MTEPRIGDLRRRMTLQSPARAEDGGGGAAVTWALVADVWAALSPVTGSEALDADRLSGRVTHEIWIRYRDGVVPAMRLVFGTRVFDIRAALDVAGRRRWLRCLVEERVA